MRKTLMKGGGAIAAVLVAMMIGGLIPPGNVNAAHEPANKTSAAGSSIEVVTPGNEEVILSEYVKTSKPTDLILGVTLECALVTNVTTTGNEATAQTAMGQVRVWVTIDGTPVPVSENDTETINGIPNDPGRVTFCNRAYGRKTSAFTDGNATIETFFSTRAANGFNWMALDVGSATHLIEVRAELTETASNKATAEAVIGKRTLIVEPTKAANDEQVTQLG